MEIKINGGVILLKHRLKKSENYHLKNDKNIKIFTIYKEPKLINGITNVTEDQKYILFLDYDETALEIIKEDIINLQKRYALPSSYLFTTKERTENGIKIGNYHIINLKKYSYEKIRKIINRSRCDRRYKSMCDRNYWKSWVLRISNKGKRDRPLFLGIIGKIKNLDCRISSAHLNFLNKIYKLPKLNYTKPDNFKKISLQKYETTNF